MEKEMYGLWFSEDTTEDFARFCSEAIKSGRRVRIIYNEGYADFSGFHDSTGLNHTLYIGKSTGFKPIPIRLCKSNSIGGTALLTSAKAIKRYGWKG